MDTPRPTSDRIQVVSWNHSGGAAGSAFAAAAFTGAAARAGAGRGFPGRPVLRGAPAAGLVPREGAVGGALFRPPAAGALVPGLGAAAAWPGRGAGLAGGHQSPLFTAVTAAEEQTLAGWLLVIWQMAPVM